MDDLEKMKTGMWLYARKPQIRKALQRCEELVFRFNSLPSSREEERNAIIRQLFGRTGGTFCIHSPFHCDFGSQISIGEDFTGNFNRTLLDEAPVTIGNHVFIGPNVGVYEGMVVGISPKQEDIVVNVCKKKQLTNTRAAGSDDALRLVPPRKMSLEQCLEFLADDELLEVTPKNLRIRKTILNHERRMKAQHGKKN